MAIPPESKDNTLAVYTMDITKGILTTQGMPMTTETEIQREELLQSYYTQGYESGTNIGYGEQSFHEGGIDGPLQQETMAQYSLHDHRPIRMPFPAAPLHLLLKGPQPIATGPVPPPVAQPAAPIPTQSAAAPKPASGDGNIPRGVDGAAPRRLWRPYDGANRVRAPAQDDNLAQKFITRFLSSRNMTISATELFALAPALCNDIRSWLTPRRDPNAGTSAPHGQHEVEVALEEELLDCSEDAEAYIAQTIHDRAEREKGTLQAQEDEPPRVI